MDGIADYEFIHLLGEGSHGSFWLAHCPERLGLDADQVAVKTIAHNASDGDFERLVAELQLYTNIASPHLVRLYDVGQQGGALYYATEYFPDGSLAQPARPFTRGSVLSTIADAAMAAHALHEDGIAHRGIKPGNVMVDGDTAKLGDIGLAHVLNPGQTVTGLDHIGSIEYLAPELIQGQAASRATDIWALGATLHRVLSGRPIYPDAPGGSLLEALRYLLREQPTINESIQPDERTLIEQTLSPDPVDRPATAREFGEVVSELAAKAGPA